MLAVFFNCIYRKQSKQQRAKLIKALKIIQLLKMINIIFCLQIYQYDSKIITQAHYN